MPDSSFEAQQKQLVGLREVPWPMAKQRKAVESCWDGFGVLSVLRGAESSFEAQQKQFVRPREVPWQSSERPSKAAGKVLRGAAKGAR